MSTEPALVPAAHGPRAKVTPAPRRRGETQTELVRVGDLKIDRSYQRALIGAHAKAIADSFDPKFLGMFTVSRRRNGEIIVVDGQHRTVALRLNGLHDQKVVASVHEDLSVKEEAEMFIRLNGWSKPPTAIAKFNASVTAEDPIPVMVQQTLNRYGLHVAGGPGKGVVQAPSALITIAQMTSQNTLDAAVGVAVAAWGDESGQLRGKLIQSIALVIHRYGSQIDVKRLTQVMNRQDPNQLLAKANAAAAMVKGHALMNVGSRIIVDLYNQRLGEARQLPAWELRSAKAIWSK